MACLRAAGQSVRKIARSPPSTLGVKRNGSRTQGSLCTKQAHARRWRGSRLERNSALRDQILARLRSRWPGAWPWRRASGSSPTRPSTGSYTPNWRGRRTTPGVSTCPSASRNVGGGVVGEGTQPHSSLSAALLQNAPRRRMTGRPQDTGRPNAVQDLWTGRPDPPRAPLPPDHQAPGESLRPHRRGYDNGTGCFASRVASDGHLPEFHQLHALGIQTFFCDTHSPWQKGGVENAIGRMRRTLTSRTSLDRFTQLVQAYIIPHVSAWNTEHQLRYF